ncbi:hypothetical protein GCM10010411_16990 [Actinomadura fulvescens]|uniref:Secreted protein n=1 Tax=Actinomadura fulvescens TaxID=46160 RepID=A0ABN3PGS0_9ACTN
MNTSIRSLARVGPAGAAVAAGTAATIPAPRVNAAKNEVTLRLIAPPLALKGIEESLAERGRTWLSSDDVSVLEAVSVVNALWVVCSNLPVSRWWFA